MREVLGDIERWRSAGEAGALATVVQTWGSAPRQPGAKMAVSASGRIAGSVSGGCVEGAVVEAAKKALATGQRACFFGVSGGARWASPAAARSGLRRAIGRLEPCATPPRPARDRHRNGHLERRSRSTEALAATTARPAEPSEPAAAVARRCLSASRRAAIAGSEMFDVRCRRPGWSSSACTSRSVSRSRRSVRDHPVDPGGLANATLPADRIVPAVSGAEPVSVERRHNPDVDLGVRTKGFVIVPAVPMTSRPREQPDAGEAPRAAPGGGSAGGGARAPLRADRARPRRPDSRGDRAFGAGADRRGPQPPASRDQARVPRRMSARRRRACRWRPRR